MEIRSTLIAAGRHIEPDVVREVLELGDAAVAPLLEVFEDEELAAADGPGDGWAPVHAAQLLGELADPRAVPALLDEYLEWDWDSYLFNAAALALVKHGKAALEPLLQAYAECDPEERGYVASIVADLGVRDERIYDALCANYKSDTPLVASAMGRYGDVRALPMLYTTFDEFDIDGTSSSEAWLLLREVADAIGQLGGELGDARTGRLAEVRARTVGQRETRGALPMEIERRRGTVLLGGPLRDFGRVFTGQGARRSAWNARGFIVAVACSPSLNEPSMWLTALLPPPKGRAGAQAAEDAIGQVFRLFNATIDALSIGGAPVVCPPSDDGAAIREFCQGFMAGVALDETWVGAKEGARELAVIEALSKSGDAASPGPVADGQEAELVLGVEALYEALAPLRLAHADRIAQGGTPVSVGPKVGRNDPCPCGSGKKYKRCCGRPG